eukprot:scaffold4310_cov105-Pinguiococcus_pyrenoidosus.AAC.1
MGKPSFGDGYQNSLTNAPAFSLGSAPAPAPAAPAKVGRQPIAGDCRILRCGAKRRLPAACHSSFRRSPLAEPPASR